MSRIAFLEFSSSFFFFAPSGCDLQGCFAEVSKTSDLFFFHACRFRMESFVTVCAFLSFSSLFSFESRGIDEGFFVPDPGGYWWPPTYSTWTPTIASFSFSVSAQFTIFSSFSGPELPEPF
jgi:hypothetical protein